MGLADFDALCEPGSRQPGLLPQAWLPNGYFTLTFPCGTHKTLRVHTQQGGKFAGRRLISLLVGPRNTSDYEEFGEITPSEQTPVLVWKHWRGSRTAYYAVLLLRLVRGEVVGGHSVEVSKRCLVCNRPLTTPESLVAGIGPECQKRGRS